MPSNASSQYLWWRWIEVSLCVWQGSWSYIWSYSSKPPLKEKLIFSWSGIWNSSVICCSPDASFFTQRFLNRLCRIYLDFKLLAFHSFYGLCRLSTNLLYTNSALIWYGEACNHGNVLCTLSQALAAVFTLYRIEQIFYILTIQLFCCCCCFY